jgi:hypothetical protein
MYTKKKIFGKEKKSCLRKKSFCGVAWVVVGGKKSAGNRSEQGNAHTGASLKFYLNNQPQFSVSFFFRREISSSGMGAMACRDLLINKIAFFASYYFFKVVGTHTWRRMTLFGHLTGDSASVLVFLSPPSDN